MKATETKIRKYFKNDDKRTVFDFKLKKDGKLQGRFVREFKEHIKEFLDQDVRKNRIDKGCYNETVLSPNALFGYVGRSFFVINQNYGRTRGGNDYFDKALLHDDRSCYEVYPYSYNLVSDYDSIAIWNSIRKCLHDLLFEDKFHIFRDCARKDIYPTSTAQSSYPKAWLSSNQINKSLRGVFREWEYVDYVHPNTYCNFETTEDDKYMTYMYQGSRVKIKLGKGIKKLMKSVGFNDFDDERIKKAVNILSSNFDDYEFVIYEGSDITEKYRGSNYDQNMDTGSLDSSCMKYESCADENFFEIYEDHCEILVLEHKETHEIIGRALLWDCYDVENDEKTKVMDRIYSSEKAYQLFFEWAKKHMYWRKRYQSYSDCYSFVHPVTEESSGKTFEVHCDLSDYNRLPYMDTFAWGDTNVIRNDEAFGRLEARDTGGGFSVDDYYDDDDDDDGCDEW